MRWNHASLALIPDKMPTKKEKLVVWIVFLVSDKLRDAGADISRIIVEYRL